MIASPVLKRMLTRKQITHLLKPPSPQNSGNLVIHQYNTRGDCPEVFVGKPIPGIVSFSGQTPSRQEGPVYS
jgi:hypothetical protein